MKIVKILGIILLLVVASFLVLLFIAPTKAKVERFCHVKADKDVIYKAVSDYNQFVQWSPWSEKDVNASNEFSPKQEQVGSWYTWDGNEEVGIGKMELIGIDPPHRAQHKITFIKPFEGVSETLFTIEDVEGENAQKVIWSWDTELKRPANVFAMLSGMETELGEDFNKGLENLMKFAKKKQEEKNTKMAQEEELEPETEEQSVEQ